MAKKTNPEASAKSGNNSQKVGSEFGLITIHPKYDVLLPIDSIHDNPEQHTIYSNTSRELSSVDIVDEFAESIKEAGLEQIPIAYKFKDGVYVFKSGMTRRKAFRKLGAQFIPVNLIEMDMTFDEYCSDDNYITRIKDVMGSNLTDKERSGHLINQFKQVDQAREKFKSLKDRDMTEKEIKELCKLNGIEYKWYNNIRTLKIEWSEKYDEVSNLKKSPRGAFQELEARNKAIAKGMPASKVGDGLFTDATLARSILSLTSNTMEQLASVKLRVGGKEYPFMNEIQSNIRSGLLHEIIVHTTKYILNNAGNKGIWETDKSGKFDLDSKDLGIVVDIKTRIEGSPSWTTAANNIKRGYYLFVETNSDCSRWFASYCYVNAEEWKKQQTVGIFTNEALYNNKTKVVLFGEIKSDKKVYLDKLI
jgi:hypothetical protein